MFRQTSILRTQTYTLGIEQIFPRSSQVSKDISIPSLISVLWTSTNQEFPLVLPLSWNNILVWRTHTTVSQPQQGLPWCSTTLHLPQRTAQRTSTSTSQQHLKHLKFWIIIIAERLQAVFVIWILVKPTYLWFYWNKTHVLSTDITKSKYIAEHNIQPWLTSHCTEHSAEPEPLAVSETDSSGNPVGSEGATQFTGLATSCRLLISQVISKYCGRGQLQPTGILRFCIVLEAQCDTLLENYVLTILVWKKSNLLYI